MSSGRVLDEPSAGPRTLTYAASTTGGGSGGAKLVGDGIDVT